MDLKRVLVAINSPNGRDAAFERALRLAQSSGAELYLLHAVPVNERFSFRAAERLARTAQMRQRAEDAGVSVQAAEQKGDPAEIIELHANARGVDLIVLGGEVRRERGSRRSLVAERVIRRTNIPTLVVTPEEADRPPAFRNVLAAIDLSPASTDLLRAAVDMTGGEAKQLTVLHTIKGLVPADAVQNPSRWMVPEFRSYVLDDALKALEDVVAGVPNEIDTRVQVSTGSTARTILEQADAVGADLVVVGRSRGFKMLGPTALRVLRKSNRSLLVIPSASRTNRVEWQRAA